MANKCLTGTPVPHETCESTFWSCRHIWKRLSRIRHCILISLGQCKICGRIRCCVLILLDQCKSLGRIRSCPPILLDLERFLIICPKTADTLIPWFWMSPSRVWCGLKAAGCLICSLLTLCGQYLYLDIFVIAKPCNLGRMDQDRKSFGCDVFSLGRFTPSLTRCVAWIKTGSA